MANVQVQTSHRNPFSLDLRALALYRIALGFVFLCELIKRFQSLDAFYIDDGMLPREHAISLLSASDWSLLLSAGSYELTALLFLLFFLVGLAFTLGYRTRLVSVLMFICMMSLQFRNEFVINGAEHVLRLLTFWNMFLPLGLRYSLDARTRLKGYPAEICDVSTAALTLQFFCVYFFSALAKLGNENWTSGKGLLHALTLEHYNRSYTPYLLRYLPESMLTNVCYLVLLVEVMGPLLLLCPLHRDRCRALALGLLIPLQFSFGLFLEVHFFPYITSVAALPFIPRSALDWLEQVIQRSVGAPSGPSTSLAGDKQLDRAALGLWALVARESILFLAVCFIFASNIESLRAKSPAYAALLPSQITPRILEPFGSIFKLRQAWDMFINPGQKSVWFVANARTRKGYLVDALRPGANSIDWARPQSFFENELWRSFLLNASGRPGRQLLRFVTKYLCKRWNQRYQGEDAIQDVSLFLVTQIHPKYDPKTPRQFILIDHGQCS